MVLSPFMFVIAALVLGVLLVLCWLIVRLRGRLNMVVRASNHSSVGVIMFDKAGRFVMANDVARDYLPAFKDDAFARGGLQGALDYLYDHAVDYDDSLLGALNQSVDDSDLVGFREVVAGPRGALYRVEARKIDGDSTALFLSNIAHIKNREDDVRKLSRFNHQLHEAVQAADSGIVVLQAHHADCRIIFANAQFCGLFSLDSADVLGRCLVDVFAALDRAALAETVNDALTNGAPMNAEICIADDDMRWCDFKLTPVMGASGALDLFIGIFNDTTTLKMKEQQLSKAQKLEALGQMAAGLAHDFNNILSIIDGYARLTANSLGAKDPLQEHLERVRNASKRGAALVSNMLTFSRHHVVSDGVIDLNAAIDEQMLLLSPLLDARIDIDVALDDRLILIEGVYDDVAQILTNVVVNARDAMPQGGRFCVATAIVRGADLPDTLRADLADNIDYACLSLTDDGVGASVDIVGKMFDPFFTTKGQAAGSGMGLSIVHGLVQKMAGDVHVETSPDAGFALHIYMPLSAKAEAKQVVGTPDDVGNFRLEGYTILLAEDETDLRLLVADMLARLGAHVLDAANGNEALLVQDEYDGQIDLLLSDVVMPELNGVELSALLTSLRPDIKTVFMSGYPAHGSAPLVDMPDGALFLAKPVRYEDLVRMVYYCLTGAAAQSDVNAPRWRNDKMGDAGEEGA